MNAILIVIDAYDQTRIEESNYLLTPNLERFAKNGIKFTNMYSQAPYTEAAVMNLYAGQNTLDRGGYLYRFGNAPKTIFECFQDNGFEVFCNTHQPQVFPSSQRRGIDYLVYDRPYDFDVLWRYRLDYYSKLLKNNELDVDDLNDICSFVEDNFAEAKEFLSDYLKSNYRIDILKPYDTNFDYKKASEHLQKEYSAFVKDKEKYCKAMLLEGRSHSFFSMPSFNVGNYILSNEIENLQNSEIKNLCKRIGRKNFIRCLFHNGDLIKSLAKSSGLFLKKRTRNDALKSFYMAKNALLMTHLKERYGSSAKQLKEQPSFNTLSNNFLDWLISRKETTKPFFACIHVDDVHFPEVFYSFDSNDPSLIREELKVANQVINQHIPGKGTIIHDLSIAYADYHIGRLVDKLTQMGVMENTVVFVTADHGFSYSGYPIRQKDINTFYLENFKIPFYIFGGKIKKDVISSLQSSVDIPSTICNIMSLKMPQSFDGINSLEEKRDYLFIDYCGGGCPDLKRREIMLAVFDSKKMLCFKLRLNESLDWKKIVEVYNLEKDPKQRKNIYKNYDKKEFETLFAYANDCFEKIKKSNTVL